MQYFLSPVVGTGTDGDPFRPQTVGEYTCIDLRPDATVPDGFMLLAQNDAPGASDRAVKIADSLLGRSPISKKLLESKLGVTLADGQLPQLLAELLIVHGRDDGSRWKPLQLTNQGFYEIHLGNQLLFTMAAIRGGATISESFNKADSATLGPDLSWTDVDSSMDVVSNKAQGPAGAINDAHSRADSDLATSNHYAQGNVTIVSSGTATDNFIGTCVRFDPAAFTLYHWIYRMGSGGNTMRLRKIVTSTITQLTNATGSVSADDLVKISINGSSLTGYKNGIVQATASDGSITGFVRTGICTQVGDTAATPPTIDNFRAGDGTGQGGGLLLRGIGR